MSQDEVNAGQNTLQRCVSDVEKTVILHVLKRTNGNKTDAAYLLGMSKRTLATKIQKYDIDCSPFESERK